MPESTPIPQTRYRIVCYELEADHETVILDATAQAFIAVTGTSDDTTRCAGKEPTPGYYRCYDASPASSPTTNDSPADAGTPSDRPGNSIRSVYAAITSWLLDGSSRSRRSRSSSSWSRSVKVMPLE